MKQISRSLYIIKKIYDFLVPSGKILQDMDKKYKFNDNDANIRITKPSFLDVLATFGVLCWMFMLKWLLDFLGIYGEIAFFLLIPLSALSHFIGEYSDFATKHIEKDEIFPRARIVEIFLLQIIYVGIAFFSIRGFIGHTILANTVADHIGWPTGSPFQYELAVYHLGFGIIGLISVWRRDSLWIGIIYAKSIFLFGAAGVHVWDIIANGNLSPGNTGVVLFGNDLILPITAIVLLHIHLRFQKKLHKSK
jgi:hypothetical protein